MMPYFIFLSRNNKTAFLPFLIQNEHHVHALFSSRRLSKWAMIDRNSFHTLIDSGESMKNANRLAFHRPVFIIRNGSRLEAICLSVCLFICLFSGARKTVEKNRLRCRFSPCDSMFFALSIQHTACQRARLCVCDSRLYGGEGSLTHHL